MAQLTYGLAILQFLREGTFLKGANFGDRGDNLGNSKIAQIFVMRGRRPILRSATGRGGVFLGFPPARRAIRCRFAPPSIKCPKPPLKVKFRDYSEPWTAVMRGTMRFPFRHGNSEMRSSGSTGLIQWISFSIQWIFVDSL